MKKKKKDMEDDDLFSDAAFSDDAGDLFSSAAVTETPKDTATASTEGTSTTTGAKGKLSPEARLARFNELRQFVDDRIGLHPPAKAARKPEQVRNTAWQHLFGLATTKEQMEQVVDMIPKWRDSRKMFTPRMAQALIRTSCTKLRLTY